MCVQKKGLVSEMEVDLLKDRVISRIKNDPKAADFRISLFISSLSNYRHDSTLRPFPPSYAKEDGTKEYKRLEAVFNTIPDLETLIENKVTLSEECWTLLDWLLDDKVLCVKSVEKETFASIQSKTGPSSYPVQPQFIFEVNYSASTQTKFQELSELHDLMMAYHGSRLDNFHSILHNGLHGHLNKNSLFGEGTYLSSDAAVCMVYSTYGPGWSKSNLGQKLSCVAVCEMIDHPGVKCQTKSNKRIVQNRARASNSEGGDVPEKYYVVTNNELLRVKYILVFVEKVKPLSARFKNLWVFRYPLASLLIIYMICLLMIGLTKSRYFQQIYKRYLAPSS